eukprot:67897_1
MRSHCHWNHDQMQQELATDEERLNYLVIGYIKNYIDVKGYEFQLITIIQLYLGNIFVLSFRFDIVYDLYKDYLKENGRLFCRPQKGRTNIDYFSVCSSTTIQDGIQKFKIKCMKASKDAIGIMSNTKTCKYVKQHCGLIENANVYYYFGSGHIQSNKKNHIDDQSNVQPSKQGDIVTVVVNCEEWNVQFMINNIQIGKTIKIEPNKAYHPFIGSFQDDVEFAVIS